MIRLTMPGGKVVKVAYLTEINAWIWNELGEKGVRELVRCSCGLWWPRTPAEAVPCFVCKQCDQCQADPIRNGPTPVCVFCERRVPVVVGPDNVKPLHPTGGQP